VDRYNDCKEYAASILGADKKEHEQDIKGCRNGRTVSGGCKPAHWIHGSKTRITLALKRFILVVFQVLR
jgi:hypothetical protein